VRAKESLKALSGIYNRERVRERGRERGRERESPKKLLGLYIYIYIERERIYKRFTRNTYIEREKEREGSIS